jgi:phosphate transport system permease protein
LAFNSPTEIIMRRKFLDFALTWLSVAFGVGSLTLLLVILGTVFLKGMPAISLEFLTTNMREAGASGGIGFHIVGTLVLLASALAVCIPMALGIALLQAVYLQGSRWQGFVRNLLYVWNGVPSILFGIFGLAVFVVGFGWGKSWLAGGILLGLMMLPTAATSLADRMRAIPNSYLLAASALGLSSSQVIRSVILPQSWGGLVTGSLLGLVRAAGETAPILFTAAIFSGAHWPSAIKDSPVLALPYHIFVLAQDSLSEDTQVRMWGTALVLLILVLMMSLLALPLRMKAHEEIRHA